LVGQGVNRAELARRLCVSRARVTQTLQLLDLSPVVVDAVAALGEAMGGTSITERLLRTLIALPRSEQERRIRDALAARTHRPLGGSLG
jgi:ParB-like chromosome segregation protein Spo0J